MTMKNKTFKARKYNTTVNAIAQENDLSGETTEDLKIVFIPAV